ncbi:MAG: hypothetical protein ACK5XO_09470, partial [Phycisphaerales bacterium]
MQIASIAAASIDAELHDRVLRAGITDSDDYQRAVEPLARIRRAVGDVSFIYTISLVDGRQVFVLDPTP